MLHELPIECLQQIIGYLPSATAIVSVALVNRALYAKISADNYGVLQYFVQRSFPTIRTASSWRDSAIALTSRSRSWNKRAVIAQECYPPSFEAISRPESRVKQKLGFVPSIDSYEIAHGSALGQRREVVAWAAGGKINVRSTTSESVTWQTLRFPRDHDPSNDILDIRLLRPDQCHAGRGERLLYRRATGEVALITTTPDTDNMYTASSFLVGDMLSDCMDISPARAPVLALCDSRTVSLYPVENTTRTIEAATSFEFNQVEDILSRQRCARFLSENFLAVAPQYLQGKQSAPIRLYDVNAASVSGRALAASTILLPSDLSTKMRHWANVITPLDKICGNNGELFLSGWSDGTVRLHDTRTGKGSEMSYTDKVDDGQILSILPIGHESFLAGSHQNGCLKTFDMRMPGARAYSYLDAGESSSVPKRPRSRGLISTSGQRAINIFLALKMPQRQAGWKPLPLGDPNTDRYRGSVYSLSAPSPSSRTVYAGIEDHVIQLDFLSTDDVQRDIAVDPIHSLGEQAMANVLDLSCYERPREGFESTDGVILRKQAGFRDVKDHGHGREAGAGWDVRWRAAATGETRGHRQRRQLSEWTTR